MNKSFFKTGLGLLALVALVVPLRAAVPATKILPGHVPPAVAQMNAVGRVSATTNLYLTIGLPVRNQAALNTLVQQLSDPASTNYQRYLTPEEFTAQFGPTLEDYQSVINFANSNGFTVVHTHANRMLVDVLAPATNVERAFHVKMKTYHHPKEARDFYAPDTEPSVNASLPVLSVQGMNNYALPRPLLKKRPASLAQPSAGSGPGGGYMGKDFRDAYLPNNTQLNGSGQIVGLVQFDGYFASDIAAYTALAGLTNVPLQNVLLDGFDGSPGINNDEVCLDIEMVISMAPALSKVVVFEAGPFGNPNDILSSMASSNQIKQLSASWSFNTDNTTRQLYLQFIVQGQTYFNASGDGDAWLGGSSTFVPYGSLEDPYTTIVGGTTLTTGGTPLSYTSEKAWNWGFNFDFLHNPDGYSGTSGGVSTDVPIPFYQVGINMAASGGSTTFRNVPDVAFTADNIFVISSGGSQGIFGGTSAATPLWAGFMALVNQQAAANGKPSIGWLNPYIYNLALTPNFYTNCFHDTVLGDNTWSQSTNNYFAVPGYDLCTGLGTPNGVSLINYLTATSGIPIVYTPFIPAPKQPWGNTLSVMTGSDPNGLWMLYFQDDTAPTGGTNYNGWAVNLTTANPIGFSADNQIYVNATNVAITPGSQWVTILAVTNWGPSVSSNVYITDNLPSGFGVSLISSNSSIPGSTISRFADTLTWNIGNLGVNAGGKLTLTFAANNSGVFTNTALVNAYTPDATSDDDFIASTVVVSVSEPPVIVPGVTVGSGGVFKLSVTNDAGASIVIQASTNLLTWLPVYTNFAPFTFTNFDTTNYQNRFYRAVVGQ